MPTNRVIRVTYSSPEDTYTIPKDLPLLSVEENDKAWRTGRCMPFSWWIKWRTFYYYDKDGNEKTLDDYRECETDYKHPENVEEDTEEVEEE
jgi:hypothetical protein